MGLADSLSKQPKRPEYLDRGCMVCRVVWSLEGTEDGKVLAEVLAAPVTEWPHAVICRALEENGHRVTRDAVTKHRNGQCAHGSR